MRIGAPALALVALLGLEPGLAQAQPTPASSASASASAPAPAPAPASASASASASAPASAPSNVTGYGWSTKKKTGHPTVAHRPPSEGPGAVVPGFEMLGDGSTRLFVQMPKAAAYTAKAGPGTITYVLKDVQVEKRNNYNPLVTVHFNTPVVSARLVPHGRDLWFVVALRSRALKVQPNVALDPAKDGTAMLRIEFPKGDYLPAAPAAAAGASENPSEP